MTPDKDAPGHVMLDELVGGSVTYMIERNDGLIDVREAKGFFLPYRRWSELDKRVLKFVRGRIVDVGCGAGRHSLYLQEKKFDVIGIDASPGAIEVCKRRGVKKAELMDMYRPKFKSASFDTLLLMGNGFGLLGSPTGAKGFLRKWHPLMAEEGIVIAEANNPDMTTLPVHLAYRDRNVERGRMPGQLRIRVRYRQYKTDWFWLMMASRQEAEQIVEGTGWKIRAFVDGKGTHYGMILEKSRK